MPRAIPPGKWQWNKDDTSPGGDWQDFPENIGFKIERKFVEMEPRRDIKDSDMFVQDNEIHDLLNSNKRERDGSKRMGFILCHLDLNFDENEVTIMRSSDPAEKLSIKTLQIRRITTPKPTLQRLALDKECEVESLAPFPHPFITNREYGTGEVPYTLKELKMMELSAAIRRKEAWELKSQNPSLIEKWKKEALCEPELFDYVISELEYYKSLKSGPLEPSTVDGVWQSDTLIADELRAVLIHEVAKLENVPAIEKDWHPGSDKKVLDLVHPSLYCFVAGETRETKEPAHPPMKFIGGGQVLTKKFTGDGNRSKKYQWLPADFQVDKSGRVSISSYINNLHPGIHRQAYGVITRILEKFVPLFEKVLTDLVNPRPRRYHMPPWGNWYGGLRRYGDDDEELQRTIIYPPIQPFIQPAAPRQVIDLRGRRLQVIVKLANIILTPENPTYDGGVWHVEGMANESIVASGIYYYDSQNISESMLGFRVGISEPMYEQNDDEGVEEVYGLINGGALNQKLGDVVTKSGRCIAFPNLFQHKVAPFGLQDKTKPGHRKILVFFLVDPAMYILSTAHVPPQQESWRLGSLRPFHPFNNLPLDILKPINKQAGMSLEQAKEHREKLMKERKFFISKTTETVFERPFSLCEH